VALLEGIGPWFDEGDRRTRFPGDEGDRGTSAAKEEEAADVRRRREELAVGEEGASLAAEEVELPAAGICREEEHKKKDRD
jgi:hypothetical protein